MARVYADLHIHTNEEIKDRYIKYSARDIIDNAAQKNINVVAITLHDKVFEKNNLEIYAKKKGVLLIQGVEATIEGKHVLIYNISPAEFAKIHSLNDLRKLKTKNKNIFVAAPHPFMPKWLTKKLMSICLQDKYFENKDIFDALEIQQFAFFLFNPNKKTIRVANADNKPLIANSDCHFMSHFGKHYTVVDVKGPLNTNNFFNSLKNGNTNKNNNVVINTNIITFSKIFFSFLLKK